MEELELTGPIVLSHLENTGINIQTDRIAEVSVIKFNPDNTDTADCFINPRILT